MDSNSEELSSNVEYLVEYVSNLVLSTVTGNLQDLNVNCGGIAEYTDKVVLKAKDIAIASHNKEIQIEITNCINGIAKSIEELVVAFTVLLPNIRDAEKKKTFALSAKNVGTSINQLIVTVDLMSSKRVIPEIEIAKELQQLLLRSYNSPLDSLIEVLRNFGHQTLQVIQLGTVAASSTADRSKSALLRHSIDDFKSSATQLMQTIKAINHDPTNHELKNELAHQYKNVLRIYNDIIDAANIVPDFSGKLNDAFEKFNKMLDFADAVRYASNSVIEGVQNRISEEEFANLARQSLQTTMNLIEQAQRALENETDPIRRAQIEQAIQHVKESGTQFIKKAKLAQQDPNNAELINELKALKVEFDNNVEKLVALTSNGMEEQKLLYTAQYLENTIDQFMLHSTQLDSNEVNNQATFISNITDRFNKDARSVASKSENPIQREKILDRITDLRKAGDRFVSDIKNFSKDTSDRELHSRISKTQKLNATQIHKVLAACGLEEERVEPHNAIDDNESDELVIAAKEQAKHAFILADDAEKMANQMNDPQKKTNLLHAIHILRNNANDVIHKARIASAEPNNLEKQIELDEIQRLLADNIKDVILLTSNAASELQDLLKAIVSKSDIDMNNVFSLADQIINDILQFINLSESIDPKQVVLQAKDIATLTTQLSTMIRKMADETNDPKEKDQFIQFSRFMRDRATQVKMISAVKAASGGQDTGQVSSSANGLKSTILECISFLKANELQRRRRATTERAKHIRELVAMWQKFRK